MSNDNIHNDLFSSLISNIKTYSGKDPILPWLRGIRRMRESLPAQLLKERLPRFLQKCTQTFESDRRYRNDLRYLRVWLQLMDYVDEPRVILRTMEKNHIGMKLSLFYQAYALYYEKVKKFVEAEKMYHLGVQNLAEPLDELQKSYEQFLHRMERHKTKKTQRLEGRTARRPPTKGNIPLQCGKTEATNETLSRLEGKPAGKLDNGSSAEILPPSKILETKTILDGSPQANKPWLQSNDIGVSEDSCIVGVGGMSTKRDVIGNLGPRSVSKQQVLNDRTETSEKISSDETVLVKFIDSAIVGKSEAEDACHHGLVEPTINMKEAMNAINSMFREPLETAPFGKRSQKNRMKEDHNSNNGFKVFVDENLERATDFSDLKEEKQFSPTRQSRIQTFQPFQEPFKIFMDDDECSNDIGGVITEKYDTEQSEGQNLTEGSVESAFVFPRPKDLPSVYPKDPTADRSRRVIHREDTVVRRFVGSTISDEPEVENVCHHGLVEPTINLKEAMDDINNMFGKPIEFTRAKRSKKQDKAANKKTEFGGFSILADDDLEHERGQPLGESSRIPSEFNKATDVNREFGGFSILPDHDDHEHHQRQPQPKSLGELRGSDLFEPTVFTKEAMDEINKMFGEPMDF